MVVNYDILGKHVAPLEAVQWAGLVFDEAHYLKNHTSARSRLARQLVDRANPSGSKEPAVYLLTGTPLTNRPRDLFVLLHAIRALALDIGFYRKVCRNGLIAPDTIVQFKFAHQQRDLGTEIRFEVARERLQELQGKFSEQFAALKKCRIPRAAFAPMVRVALMMRPLKETRPGTREAEDWRALDVHITERCNRYASELGETAYALLNTVTDLASHPPENRHLRRDRHSLQRLAGTWLTTFSNECRQRGFAIDRFIARMKAL